MNKRFSSSNLRRRFRFPKTMVSNPMMMRALFLCCTGVMTGLAIVVLNGHNPAHALGSTQLPRLGQLRPTQIAQLFKLPSPSETPISTPPVEAVPSETLPEQTAELPDNGTKPETAAEKSVSPFNQYALEFNRSPIVGNRFRLEGTYAEARLGFTRPRTWNLKSAKAIVRFQHSPALVASKSDLVVRVNDTSIGSVPLNLKNSQIGEAVFTIPAKLIQNENELAIAAQQNNSATCSNPDDKSLWSEVLPDSKIVFEQETQPTTLDFSRYPFPFFDSYGLDASRIGYLLPSQISEGWLTATSRFQTTMGRLADFRPLETSLIKTLKPGGNASELGGANRIVIVGTPAEQSVLKSLNLPFKLANNQILDGNKTALPEQVGVLMLTTINDGNTPVLVVSGNGAEGVAKAMQFLVQPTSHQIGTGQGVIVSEISELSSPQPREWERYLPARDAFKLSDLKGLDNRPFRDVTVRGTSAPPVQFNFRALPDDRFLRGSSMNLKYSYSSQINPKLSTLSVRIDGVGIGSKKLASDNGASQETFNVDLPANLITSNSVIDVAFDLYPKDLAKCGQASDQQLWGTVHRDTSFNTRRENAVELPDLKLLTTGYPFTAPQDLSKTAIVLADSPTASEVMTLLKLSERLGRLSQASSVKLEVYKATTLPESIRKERHLIGIGTRDRFPLKEAFENTNGFRLMDVFGRQLGQEQIQTLPDANGVVKSVLSPWNSERVLMALSAQTENGLKHVQDLIGNDLWFYQLKNDTVLINANGQAVSSYDSNAYQLQFFDQADRHRIENTNFLSKTRRFLQEQWYLVPIGIITASLLLYGVAQLFLKRVAE
ncbi:cellulose biosynthesis cyclic di-GMP-binding regulatory protein BcsB [Myxacorys almedinensis]|uniref:Cellulose biosynthesis cyclic di-GMP-binding regulatory protein BcsB n=1 Tax=Myxacorys almedinensis A TaxID=2690445 RepID=A0A8J7Z2F9_9CYAN|nr:cellulose biosynthesis cyclic di-GMP-binding regulatory protein BcsB [Myxacorys almedinensis]NDJ16571.1 cellulose biosynthesis cyclic di-GMP-binding regulatory protein BcsB [Myxacorys almedinensis A]